MNILKNYIGDFAGENAYIIVIESSISEKLALFDLSSLDELQFAIKNRKKDFTTCTGMEQAELKNYYYLNSKLEKEYYINFLEKY